MSPTDVRVIPKLGRHSNGMLLTPEEFDSASRWDRAFRYELIRGVVIVTPVPSEAETDPNGELEYVLRDYKRNHPAGSSLDKTLVERYVAVPGSRRRADRVLWAGLGRLPDPRVDVPTIVVEFVSKRNRDRIRDDEEKRREYLAAGVREFWIIDRFRRTLTVFRAAGIGPEESVISADGVYQTPLLPGFQLPLAQILAVADDWERPRP